MRIDNFNFSLPAQRVCFFTEPRDPEVNYQTINELTERGVTVFIKLHPLEAENDYKHRFSNVEENKRFWRSYALFSVYC